MRRREKGGAEKRKRGCGEEKKLYFGATVEIHPDGGVLREGWVPCWGSPGEEIHPDGGVLREGWVPC